MGVDAFFREHVWTLPVLGISLGLGIHYIKSALKSRNATTPTEPAAEYIFIELVPGAGANPLELAGMVQVIYEELRRKTVEDYEDSEIADFLLGYLMKIDAQPCVVSMGAGRSAKIRFSLPPDGSSKGYRETARVALLSSAAQKQGWMNDCLRVARYEVNDEQLKKLGAVLVAR